MSFSREDLSDENGYKEICYYPNESHPWLNKILLTVGTDTKKQKYFELHINLGTNENHDQATNGEDITFSPATLNKLRELSGLKQLFEDLNARLDDPLIVSFDVSPTSKIKEVLRIAAIPTDMRLAIESDLERIWREKAK